MGGDGADLGGIELQDKGQLSARAISKREEFRKTNRFFAGTQIRGQYMTDPNYEVWCLGNSKRDVIISVLFLLIWGFTALTLSPLNSSPLRGIHRLWVNFVVFALFVSGIGVAVNVGQRAKAERDAAFEKEHQLSKGV